MGLFLKGGSTQKTNKSRDSEKEASTSSLLPFSFRQAYIVGEVTIKLVFLNKQLTFSRALSIKNKELCFFQRNPS